VLTHQLSHPPPIPPALVQRSLVVIKRRIVPARLGVPENQQGLHLGKFEVFGVLLAFPGLDDAPLSAAIPVLHRADADYRVKLIVTVTRTGTGTPFKNVGVYSHCRTASSAA
jgi:hypothetical protein